MHEENEWGIEVVDEEEEGGEVKDGESRGRAAFVSLMGPATGSSGGKGVEEEGLEKVSLEDLAAQLQSLQSS